MRGDHYAGSWLCPYPGDRVRMLDMERRLAPVRAVTFLTLGITLASAGTTLGWWPLAPLAAAVIGFTILGRGLERSSRPEYRLAAAWLLSQGLIAMSIALTGGQDSPALAWLVIPAVTLPARFGRRGLIAGAGVTVFALFAVTAGSSPADVAGGFSPTIATLSLIVCVLVLLSALMGSDLEHRAGAVIDGLTGMLNRQALAARVAELTQQARHSAQPVALIVIDVDRFKQLNDQHGHPVGDAVLTEVARRIRGELRAYDSAYRIGGDEFLVVLPGAGVAAAVDIGQALRSAVALDPVGDLNVTVSVGVSASPEGEFEYADVLERADRALYEAKAAGRNRVSTSTGLRVADDEQTVAA